MLTMLVFLGNSPGTRLLLKYFNRSRIGIPRPTVELNTKMYPALKEEIEDVNSAIYTLPFVRTFLVGF